MCDMCSVFVDGGRVPERASSSTNLSNELIIESSPDQQNKQW